MIIYTDSQLLPSRDRQCDIVSLHRCVIESLRRSLVLSAFPILLACLTTQAKMPSILPGEEITEQQYFNRTLQRDSVGLQPPAASPQSKTWLDSSAKTWDAPSIALQMAQDPEVLKMGMGAVFIPRMVDAEAEPNVEILDEQGEVVGRGKPGRKYNLIAGRYYVMLGSGAHSQRIVKQIDAIDGMVVPVIPDWSALTISVVTEGNVPFRGEYELVRIDKFEPLGRGYGRDPDLGEELKSWILKPGLYKVLGVGQSYNALTNFITVRLLPGEHVQMLLVQDENTMAIRGGGTVNTDIEKPLASNWSYGIDIGGSIDFNSTDDRLDTTSSSTNLSLSTLSRLRLNYEKDRFEWDSRLWFDEGVLYSREERLLKSQLDEVRLMSLFTWRILKWFGPYGRFEGQTELVPQYARQPATSSEYYFVHTNEDWTLDRIEGTKNGGLILPSRNGYLLRPALSPLIIEMGLGANVRVANTRFIDARLLAGIGFKQESRFNETELGIDDSVRVGNSSLDSAYLSLKSNKKDYAILRTLGTTTSRPEYGPEVAINALARLGHMATLESEFKILAPIERMLSDNFRPDMRWRASLSWRLFKSVTLDYQILYNLRWPDAAELRDDTWQHRVLLRFSYTSR